MINTVVIRLHEPFYQRISCHICQNICPLLEKQCDIRFYEIEQFNTSFWAWFNDKNSLPILKLISPTKWEISKAIKTKCVIFALDNTDIIVFPKRLNDNMHPCITIQPIFSKVNAFNTPFKNTKSYWSNYRGVPECKRYWFS